MAQDYVVLNGKSDNGVIAVNKTVFKSIADISVDEIENAVRIPNSKLRKSVEVSVENNRLSIEVDIEIKYGANVNATCELVQDKIYENVLFMTGYKVSEIKVNVIGFEIEA